MPFAGVAKSTTSSSVPPPLAPLAVSQGSWAHAAMVVAFISAWFPLTLVNILRDFAALPGFVEAQPWFWMLIVHLVAMTTVLANPVLFFWLTRKSTARTRCALRTNSAFGRPNFSPERGL